MWSYEKKLQYPVNIKNPNPKLAQMIISQYGGARFKSYVNIISQITRPRTLICARTLISRSEKEMPSLDIKNPIPIFCGTHPAQWQRPHNAQPKPQKYMVFLIMPVKPTLELRS